MPTRETDVLAKTTLVFSQSTATAVPSPSSTATNTPTETATSQPTAVPTDVSLENNQPTEQPVDGEGINVTPAIPTAAPVQPTLTVAGAEDEQVPQPTTPQETVTFNQTEVAPAAGPESTTTETPVATIQTTETTASQPTQTPTPVPATSTPEPNSPVASPTATVELGASDSPNVQISVGSARIPVDETATIEVEIERINAEVGEVTLSITYDANVATLISCKMGALTGICSPDGDGFISLTAVNNGNVQPDILLATLEFQGLSPGNSTIEISQVDSIVNLEGVELNHITQSGSITVP